MQSGRPTAGLERSALISGLRNETAPKGCPACPLSSLASTEATRWIAGPGREVRREYSLNRLIGQDSSSSGVQAAMSFEPRKTWYVTFELPKSKRRSAARRSSRLSETFLTEDEARAFARERHNQGLIVSAGTLNPHLPRQMISSEVIHEWIGDVAKHDSSDISKIDADLRSVSNPPTAGR